MVAERQRLEEQIVSIEAQLQSYPEGKLLCARNGKHYRWYQSDGHNKVNILKKERQFAERLAAKKYLSYLVEDLKKEQKAIDFYLRHHNSNLSQIEKMLTELTQKASGGEWFGQNRKCSLIWHSIHIKFLLDMNAVCYKLQLYTLHGIIPSIHLITTFETQKKQLGLEKIEKTITEFICMYL